MMRLITAALILSIAIACSGDAFAAREITTVQGILGTSTADKGVLKSSDNKEYYFDTTTAAGKKIMTVCQLGKVCIVRGVIKGGNILTAYYVEMEK